MKKDLHPKYEMITIKCACGNEVQVRDTVLDFTVDICNACHPFFTGKQKLVDSAGRVEKFRKRYGIGENGSTAEALERAEKRRKDKETKIIGKVKGEIGKKEKPKIVKKEEVEKLDKKKTEAPKEEIKVVEKTKTPETKKIEEKAEKPKKREEAQTKPPVTIEKEKIKEKVVTKEKDTMKKEKRETKTTEKAPDKKTKEKAAIKATEKKKVKKPTEKAAKKETPAEVVATSGGKFHKPECRYAKGGEEITRNAASDRGLEPCDVCKP